MSENSKIQWTDATWQVTAGCSRVSPGCDNCYAIRDAHRLAGNPNPKISGPRQGVTRRRSDMPYPKPGENGDEVFPNHQPGSHGRGVLDWTGKLNLMPQNLAWPLGKKKPLKIFVNSNSDLFHASVPLEYIAAVFGVMAACPQHTFQVLTKRPERMREFFAWLGDEHSAAAKISDAFGFHIGACLPEVEEGEDTPTDRAMMAILEGVDWMEPLPNVWLGVSVENQKTADARIPLLLQCPAAIRFISYEPALGPVDFNKWIGLHQIIVGGESGPDARPFDITWARSVIAQCKAAGAACFTKQLGARPVSSGSWPTREFDELPPMKLKDPKGGDMQEWPKDLRVREFPEARGTEALA